MLTVIFCFSATALLVIATRRHQPCSPLTDERLGQLAISPEESDEANRATLNELAHEIRGTRGRIVDIDPMTGVVTREDDQP